MARYLKTPQCCAYKAGPKGLLTHRCRRVSGYGPGGLFCQEHGDSSEVPWRALWHPEQPKEKKMIKTIMRPTKSIGKNTVGCGDRGSRATEVVEGK